MSGRKKAMVMWSTLWYYIFLKRKVSPPLSFRPCGSLLLMLSVPLPVLPWMPIYCHFEFLSSFPRSLLPLSLQNPQIAAPCIPSRFYSCIRWGRQNGMCFSISAGTETSPCRCIKSLVKNVPFNYASRNVTMEQCNRLQTLKLAMIFHLYLGIYCTYTSSQHPEAD